MKKIILLAIMAACVLFGCTPSEKESLYNVHETPKLVVFVYDITASTNAYTILNEQHLTDLFHNVAFEGGGTFVSINIKSKSNQQDVRTIQIPQIDTLRLTGNVYQRKKIMDENKNLLSKAQTAREDFLTHTKDLVTLDKNEKRSDVATALRLAQVETDLDLYQDHDKYIIIVSDLLDNVTTKGNNRVDFGDAKVILVRPNEKQQMVNATKLNVANSIDEAVRMISK